MPSLAIAPTMAGGLEPHSRASLGKPTEPRRSAYVPAIRFNKRPTCHDKVFGCAVIADALLTF